MICPYFHKAWGYVTFIYSTSRSSENFCFDWPKYLKKWRKTLEIASSTSKLYLQFGPWGLDNLKTCLAASRHCAVAFSLQVPNSGTYLNPTLLYILISGTYSKLVRENKKLALSVYFPQPCSSSGRRFATSRSRWNYCRTIGSFPQNQIRWNAL